MMLYPRDTGCDAAGINTMFLNANESKLPEIGFWANGVWKEVSYNDLLLE
jgi:hypothetical protein